MNRLAFTFAFAVILYVASPVGQAFATSHVRPPNAALGHPIPTDTEWTRGEYAAWAQALLTLLAFAGAIYFSRQGHQRSIKMFEEERRREEGIRHLRAHSLAHALYPDLLEVKAMIPASEAAISRQRAKGPNVYPPHDVTQDWKINTPEGLQSAGEMFYLLGTGTAPVVSQLLSLLHQHNRVAGRLIEELNDEGTFARASSVFVKKELFANRFRLMKEDVEKALDLVGKIRDKHLLPEYTLEAKNDQKDNVAPDGTATDPDDTVPS